MEPINFTGGIEMGGNLAITLILEDGKTYKMDRWTNTFPNFVNNMKFIRKDPIHIQNYLKSWLEMKEDWGKNGPDGPFEFNMTNVYFPHFEMAPSEYGLVVLDMQKNKIYSQQGYATPGHSHRVLERLEEMRENYEYLNEWDKGELKRLDDLENNGRIEVIRDREGFQMIKIDLSPFEIKIFEDHNKEASIQYMKLLDKEYGLSKKEKQMWDDYISYLGE
jgi:hypothetical protein